MKFVITGSLGHISRPLTVELLQNGHSVTLISSDPKKRAMIEAMGATAAIGSVEDAAFLQKSFSGADAVYCMTPPNYGDPDQVAYYVRTAAAYAEAISRSGVTHAVYLSSYGAHLSSGTGFIKGSHKAEAILNALPGLDITHLRPTYFYYNLFGFLPMIRTAGFIGAVYGGEDRLALVSPRDIATAVAEELVNPHQGVRVRYLTSDDRSCSEVARVLGEAIGLPELEWKILPPEAVLPSLQASGMPRNAAENLVELGMAIHSGALRADYDKHKPPYGKVSLEAFAREFANVYQQQPQTQTH